MLERITNAAWGCGLTIVIINHTYNIEAWEAFILSASLTYLISKIK
jgi:hypothetical protein